jgi:hypothetical protein
MEGWKEKVVSSVDVFFRSDSAPTDARWVWSLVWETQLYPSFMHASCPVGGRYPTEERVFGIDLGSGARPSKPLGLTGPLPTEIGLLSEAKLLYFDENTITCVLCVLTVCSLYISGVSSAHKRKPQARASGFQENGRVAPAPNWCQRFISTPGHRTCRATVRPRAGL